MHTTLLASSIIFITFYQINYTDAARLVNCRQNVYKVGYGTFPPYSHVVNGKVSGAIGHIAQLAISTCCGSNINFSYVTNFHSLRSVEEQVTTEDVVFPVVKTSLTVITDELEGYYFVPVMETAGSVLIYDKSKINASPVGHALLQCWPLAILVISSAGLAGILMWMLDRYHNSDEFPKPFFRGGWEGTWWAYVTMTTVGYGDRAPKSIPARVFGLIWMFIGIVMMSIFTATLSTAFTSVEVESFRMKGSKIGVLRGSLEHLLAYREGSIVTTAETIDGLMLAVQNKSVEALLLDINFALFLIRTIEENNLGLGEELNHKAVYGAIFQNQADAVEQCFAKIASQSQFKAYDELTKQLGVYHKESRSKAVKTTADLMVGFYSITIATSVCWVVALIGAILWDCLYYRPKLRKDGSPATDTSKIEDLCERLLQTEVCTTLAPNLIDDAKCMFCFKKRTAVLEEKYDDQKNVESEDTKKKYDNFTVDDYMGK